MSNIYIVIIWVLCAWFAVWRWVQDFGYISLFRVILFIPIAPVMAFVSALVWPMFALQNKKLNCNPVIWRKRQ